MSTLRRIWAEYPQAAFLAVLAIGHLAVSLFSVAPGYLSVDEVTYHLMVKNLADGRGLEIWNGYEELPSQELVAASLVAQRGRLVAAPPSFYPVLAQPFYRTLGYRGLFLLSSLAFVGVVGLTWGTARRLSGDTGLAWTAALLVAASTFLWEYSQAAWPHAATTLFVAAAVWAAVRAREGNSSLRWAFLAGLAAGLGAGLRLDAILVTPALLLPFVFSKTARWRESGALVLGLLPGLAFLSVTNWLKFGTAAPFSYGKADASVSSGIGPYLPIAAVGGILVAAAWLATRSRSGEGSAPVGRRGLALGVALVAIATWLYPLSRSALVSWLDGAWQLVVDLRVRDVSIVEPAVSRGPGGGMVYLGALKKSLLQSCPYFVVILVPVIEAVRRTQRTRRRLPSAVVWLLGLPCLTYIGVYSFFAWHGGLCLNLRYFAPILPFAAILAAFGWRSLRSGSGSSLGLVVGVGGATGALFFLARRYLSVNLAQQEFVYLSLPLFLAATLAATLSIGMILRGERVLVRSLSAALFVAGATWAGLVTVAYDWPISNNHRSFNLSASQRAAELLPRDALVITPYTDAFWGLVEHGTVRIANPTKDGYRDFRRLVDFHLARDRQVFAALNPRIWPQLRDRGLLDGLSVERLWEEGEMSMARLGR